MNNKMPMPSLAAELAVWLQKNAKTPAKQAKLARTLFDEVAATLLAGAPNAGHIAAPNAVVEVQDEATGLLYRRYLELAYDETDNGLRLIGEDMAGAEAQIVFLSNTALERLHDLGGKGADAPRCDHSNHN